MDNLPQLRVIARYGTTAIDACSASPFRSTAKPRTKIAVSTANATAQTTIGIAISDLAAEGKGRGRT